MIRITSEQDKFIRCRVVHPKGVMTYPDKTFSEEQIEVLKKEPKLKIEIIEDEILKDINEEKSKSKKKTKKTIK